MSALIGKLDLLRVVCSKCERYRLHRLIDERGRELKRYQINYGATLKVADGQTVEEGQELAEWDPFTFAILTEEAGTVTFKDLIEGVTRTRRAHAHAHARPPLRTDGRSRTG